MDKAEIQEALITLYLRLNGYFTSGFIVHSPVIGQNKTEIDVLAVRFPKNAEPERQINTDEGLDPTDSGVDVIIGEVKSRGQQLHFNAGLRTQHSVSAVLRWIGMFDEQEIDDLAVKLLAALDPAVDATKAAPTVCGPRNTRIRGILFSPERDSRRNNQAWHLPGPPVLNYIWKCLRPPTRRPECATVYDFGLWGRDLAPLVRFFKDGTVRQPNRFRDVVQYFRANGSDTARSR
jgi:hypothetical protein